MNPLRTLHIEDDYVSEGLGGRPLYFRCSMRDQIGTFEHGVRKTEYIPCGGDSIAVISYFTETGNQISHHVCERHLKKAVDGACFLEWSVVDERRQP